MAESFIVALIICIFNTLAALFVIRRAYRGDESKFNKTVFASMVVRYMIVSFLVWLCLQVIELDPFLFSLTFLIATFILIMAEILYLNYRSNLLNLQNHLTK